MTPPNERGPRTGRGPKAAESITGGTGRPVQRTAPDRHDARYQLLPPLTEDEYAALHDDIAENGVRVPVVVDQHGHILDGHHRVAIAEEIGIEYRTDVVTVVDDDHARRLARVYNLTRRHLSRAQRRELIADEIDADSDRSDRAIGRLLGVDHKTVGSVRRELAGEVPHPPDGPEVEITEDEAQEITDSINGVFNMLERAILEALGHRVEPATIVGWLTTLVHNMDAELGTENGEALVGPFREFIIDPYITWLIEHGQRFADEVRGGDEHYKRLTDEELADLGAAISSGGAR